MEEISVRVLWILEYFFEQISNVLQPNVSQYPQGNTLDLTSALMMQPFLQIWMTSQKLMLHLFSWSAKSITLMPCTNAARNAV